MHALESLHYRVTEQLTHRFVHSFCGNVACGGGNNTNQGRETVTKVSFSLLREVTGSALRIQFRSPATDPALIQVPLIRIKTPDPEYLDLLPTSDPLNICRYESLLD